MSAPFPLLRPLLSLAVLACAPVDAADTRHVVMLVGNPVGEQIVTQSASGELTVRFRFSDRGRGPETTSEYRLDEAGLPLSATTEGVDYMKAPVRETFRRDAGAGAWTSGADSGRSRRGGFYLSLDGPPEEVALLARALLAAEDGRLDLLPTGSARIERVERVTLARRELQHVELHGLGFEPTPLWLNPDGSLFALVDGWFALVEEGQEAIAKELEARQNARRDARFAAVARRARNIPAGAVLIDNARILDVRTGTVREENAVLVEDGRIAALLGAGDRRPAGATVVDAHGQTLLPGLWDMHAHLDLIHGTLNIAAGVTTARDLANDHDKLSRAIAQFDSGEAVGPHVLRAGIIDGTGQYAGPTPARVEDEADALRWVDFYADHGYQQIKIYSSVPLPLVPVITRRAHERGLKVSGHIPAGMWAEDAVRAGFDEIQHANMLFLNFYKDVTETRNPDRFTKVAERGADLDLASDAFRDFVALLKSHDVVVDPTVGTLLDLFVHVPGRPAPTVAAIYERLPAQVARGTLKGGLAVPEGQEQRYAASAQRMLDVVKALHDAGVRLVAGTDALPGFALHAELEIYARAGIPPAEVLRIATLGAAEVAGVAQEVGAIEPGLRADLVLVDGQPDRRMSDIRKVVRVMKDGVFYDPAVLHEAIGVSPAR